MPAVSEAKYVVNAAVPARGVHWHVATRTKACILCGEERPLSSFYSYGYTTKQGKASTRYESRCIECSKARRKADYRASPDRDAATSQRWRDANRSRISAYNLARQTSSAHRANKAKAQRIRKATLRSGEGSSAAIKAIYAEAIRIEQLVSCCPVFGLPELGYKMHVDHIIPLSKGGRHVASNLQILPAGLNLRKGTKCPL